MARLQPHEIDERAAEARALLNSNVMKQVFDDLEREYVNRLIHCEVGELTATTAHASMKVLADVKARLQSYINDGLFQQRTGKR